MTGEQVRWGLENLALDQKKLDALGFAGVMRPISTSCADHMGAAWARIHTWDGSKWNVHAPTGCRPTSRSSSRWSRRAADKYAAEKKLTRAHARGLPVLTTAPPRLACRRPTPPRSGRRQRPGAAGSAAALDEAHDMSQHPPQRQRHRGHLQPRDPGAQGRVAAGARRRHRRAARRQRRRQDDHAARGVATCCAGERGEVTKGSIELRGERIEKLSHRRHGRARRDPGDGRPALLRAPDDRGEPADRRLHAQATARPRSRQTLEKVYAYFPRLKTRRTLAGRLHLGRRAADVRDRPRADGQPEDGAARRAVDGPGAADRRGGVRDREGPEHARSA